jgi:hypothetical protein
VEGRARACSINCRHEARYYNYIIKMCGRSQRAGAFIPKTKLVGQDWMCAVANNVIRLYAGGSFLLRRK